MLTEKEAVEKHRKIWRCITNDYRKCALLAYKMSKLPERQVE